MRKSIVVVLLAAAGLVMLGPPALALTGKVVAPGGQPIAKAKVVVTYYLGKSVTVYADEKGEFPFDAPPDANARYISFLAVANHYTYNIGYYQADQKEPMLLILYPEKKFKGKVVDEAGKPIGGAIVSLERYNAYGIGNNIDMFYSSWGIKTEVTTKSDGTFILPHMPDPSSFNNMDATYSVTADGRALIRKNPDGRHMTADQTIVLPKECRLTGTVYLPDNAGKAPEGTVIAAQLIGQDNSLECRSAKVGPSGQYAIDKLPPGKVNVFLLRQARGARVVEQVHADLGDAVLPAVLNCEVAANQIKTLDLKLIHGTLLKCNFVNTQTKEAFNLAYGSVRHPGVPDELPDIIVQKTDNEATKYASAYVVPGEVYIQIQHAADVDFHSNNAPTQKVTIKPGVNTEEVTFDVDPAEARANDVFRPVPKDIELVTGTYSLEWDPEAVCNNFQEPAVDNMLKLNKLPRMKSKSPKLFVFQLDSTNANSYFYVAVDESKGTGKGYDTAYFDTNRNLDLSDEKPVKLDKTGLSLDEPSRATDWVTIASHQGPAGPDQTKHPATVQLSVTIYNGDVYPDLNRKGAWVGKLKTNKGEVKCQVVDENANGIWNDQNCQDFLFADLNGTGRFDAVGSNINPQALPQMGISMIADKTYEIRVNAVGNKVTVAPYTGPMGKLVVQSTDVQGTKCDIYNLMLQSDKGTYQFANCDGNPINLPAGKYKIAACMLAVPPEGQDKPIMTCGTGIEADVRADQQTSVDLCGKITAEVKAETPSFKPGDTGYLDWTIKIGDKINVNSINFSNTDKSPDVILKDEAGNEVQKLKAGYT